jgi:predicted metalloprotease with PDZ domain
MRHWLIAALACIIASGTGVARSAAPGPVSYEVTPELADGRLVDLSVQISLNGDADGVTNLRMPDRWSGAEELYRAIHDVKATGAKLRRLSDSEYQLSAAPGAPILLSYKIKQDFKGELTAGEGPPFRPVVRADRFTALGWATFAEVAGPVGRPVSFRWGQVPTGWTVASDLDHQGGVNDTGDLLDSVMVGGSDLHMVTTEAAGGRVRIAMHGDWKFTPAQMASLIDRIAVSASDFWGDKGQDFFVAVTPMASPSGQGSAQYGVGLGDAFSLWSTTEVDEPALRHIVTHEHEHVWFPGRVGGVRTGRDEPLDYWLSEGFTDFYTLRILLRSGLWTPEEFVADYNRILRDYANSPVIAAPNSVVAQGFFEDPAVADLPYQRGLLLAALWDQRLRTRTNGAHDLDDVVRAMRDRAAGQTEDGAAVANLQASYAALGGDLGADMTNLVDKGQPMLLPADLFGDCARVVTTETRAFDRGFDSARTNAAGGVVQGVAENGPAYAAGLRNGMRIVGRLSPAVENDPRVELMYQVVDKGGSGRLIRYRPQGSRSITLQEIVLTPDMAPAKRAACTRSMAGQ